MDSKLKRFGLIKQLRLINHKIRYSQSHDINLVRLKYQYVRYADDWIILINGNEMLAIKIKNFISHWLKENLDATLSVEKTSITHITENSAHFLGFEILASNTRKLEKVRRGIRATNRQGQLTVGYKNVRTKVAGMATVAQPDRKRLINRFYMKGYCDKYGIPKSIPWLSSMEHFTIIERFNAVIRGFFNYYVEFIRNPNLLSRWFYILKF